MTLHVQPVVMAGGSGTRLWPASRKDRPKQFLRLVGAETLLQATVRRARAISGGRVLVVTAQAQAALVQADSPTVEIVAEPLGRNTAIAIGLAATLLAADDPEAILGVLPADQHITDEAGLAAVIGRAFAAAERADVICTVGVVPTRAETGYGYLLTGAGADPQDPGVRVVERFVEKPDAATAAAYLAGGRHLWNAGMFFARARVLLAEIERHLPTLGAALVAIGHAPDPAARAAAIDAAYRGAASVSIDHGVMEKAARVVTIPAEVGWNDVGSWAALADLAPGVGPGGGDAAGNAVVGDDVVVLDGAGNVVMSDGGVVALCGVSDLVVVRAGDAVLVLPRERAQDVKAVIAELERRGLLRYL